MICVVAADAPVRQALTILLRSAGFHATGFESAGTLFEALALQSGFCCLVIDHHLPGGIDALAVLSQMVQMGLSLPAVIANASSTTEFHRRALQSGAVAIIPKPLVDDTILDAIAQVSLHISI
jgi:FixJ family two-component response regulator